MARPSTSRHRALVLVVLGILVVLGVLLLVGLLNGDETSIDPPNGEMVSLPYR